MLPFFYFLDFGLEKIIPISPPHSTHLHELCILSVSSHSIFFIELLVEVKALLKIYRFDVASFSGIDLKSNGGYSEGVPPLTIPNREVKPLSADGTATVGE